MTMLDTQQENQNSNAIRDRDNQIADLKEKNDELNSIFFTASHDLRSPLINIEGFSREIKNDLQRLSETLANCDLKSERKSEMERIINTSIPESLKYIQIGTARLDKVLTGLQKLSQLGNAALNFETINTRQLITDVINSIQIEIRRSGAIIELLEIPDCYGDTAQLNQLFSNLICNALKYRHPEKTCTVQVSGVKKDDKIEFLVEDNGIGIQESRIEDIFDTFYRINPDGPIPGNGLGLTIVKRILARHRGKIRVESNFENGSRFYFSLGLR
jgi:signal transduction histidine kinase